MVYIPLLPRGGVGDVEVARSARENDDPRHIVQILPRPLDHLYRGHPLHVPVQQQEIERIAFQGRDDVTSVGESLALISRERKCRLGMVSDQLVIIRNRNAHRPFCLPFVTFPRSIRTKISIVP